MTTLFHATSRGDVPLTQEEEDAILAKRAAAAQPSVEKYTEAVQAHLDAVARQHGYDNIYTAATYADEPSVAVFQTEGQALRAWRSLVWEQAREVQQQVMAAMIPAPTIAQLIAMLPAAPQL